jgi:hypothetical protein
MKSLRRFMCQQRLMQAQTRRLNHAYQPKAFGFPPGYTVRIKTDRQP